MPPKISRQVAERFAISSSSGSPPSDRTACPSQHGWFLWDGDSFLVYSKPNTRKLRNIAHDFRVALNPNCDEWGSKVVVIAGEASIDRAAPPANRNAAYAEEVCDGIAQIEMMPESMASEYCVAIQVRTYSMSARVVARFLRVELMQAVPSINWQRLGRSPPSCPAIDSPQRRPRKRTRDLPRDPVRTLGRTASAGRRATWGERWGPSAAFGGLRPWKTSEDLRRHGGRRIRWGFVVELRYWSERRVVGFRRTASHIQQETLPCNERRSFDPGRPPGPSVARGSWAASRRD